MLRIKLSVMAKDETNRYSKAEADNSRFGVISIRNIVENVHVHQKKFCIHRHPIDLSDLKKHFSKYHKIRNAPINRLGCNTRRAPTWSNYPSKAFDQSKNRGEQLANNPYIISTNLSYVMFYREHDLFWDRRKKVYGGKNLQRSSVATVLSLIIGLWS